MEEILLEEYLRDKEHGMSNKTFIQKMKDTYRNRPRLHDESTWGPYYGKDKKGMMSMIRDLDDYDRGKLMFMLNRDSSMSEHEAKHLVSEMWHSNNGKKYLGEKFDMHKAQEVYNKYKQILDDYTVEDVYIAINAQYHDYCSLFKLWFGDNIDNKIIESAIKFWFMDVDYQGGNKVHEYFKEV
jgi:hypothetical protein